MKIIRTIFGWIFCLLSLLVAIGLGFLVPTSPIFLVPFLACLAFFACVCPPISSRFGLDKTPLKLAGAITASIIVGFASLVLAFSDATSRGNDKKAEALIASIQSNKSLTLAHKEELVGRLRALVSNGKAEDKTSQMIEIANDADSLIAADESASKAIKPIMDMYNVPEAQARLMYEVSSMKIDTDDNASIEKFTRAFMKLTNPCADEEVVQNVIRMNQTAGGKKVLSDMNKTSFVSRLLTIGNLVQSQNELSKLAGSCKK